MPNVLLRKARVVERGPRLLLLLTTTSGAVQPLHFCCLHVSLTFHLVSLHDLLDASFLFPRPVSSLLHHRLRRFHPHHHATFWTRVVVDNHVSTCPRRSRQTHHTLHGHHPHCSHIILQEGHPPSTTSMASSIGRSLLPSTATTSVQKASTADCGHRHSCAV